MEEEINDSGLTTSEKAGNWATAFSTAINPILTLFGRGGQTDRTTVAEKPESSSSLTAENMLMAFVGLILVIVVVAVVISVTRGKGK